MIEARTTSAESTRALGVAVANVVEQHDLLLLSGELGSGKTTFAQGFAEGLGISEQVTSPTFVLLRSYEGRLRLHHVDVYRLENLREVIDIGLLELLDEGGVALIEWGELAAPALPRDLLEVRFTLDVDNDECRTICFTGVGHKWGIREKMIAEAVGSWMSPDSAGKEAGTQS